LLDAHHSGKTGHRLQRFLHATRWCLSMRVRSAQTTLSIAVSLCSYRHASSGGAIGAGNNGRLRPGGAPRPSIRSFCACADTVHRHALMIIMPPSESGSQHGLSFRLCSCEAQVAAASFQVGPGYCLACGPVAKGLLTDGLSIRTACPSNRRDAAAAVGKWLGRGRNRRDQIGDGRRGRVCVRDGQAWSRALAN
jgi:hypothetical protein